MEYPGVHLEVNDPNFDIKEAPIRDDSLNFIRKVYGIMSAQLLVTAIVSAIVMSNPIYSEFVQENYVFAILAAFCAIALYILLNVAKIYLVQFLQIILFCSYLWKLFRLYAKAIWWLLAVLCVTLLQLLQQQLWL
ncbi:unnamed protein product [Blepharisma stoltei]|uniref:Uncharacterized protein n=1 Tax=Blepharisma stoltei TaxID=1481888 RepID=A0AAU9ITG1_9CILI|nr:unnamed protein product [Blepharisma stoltei]